MPKTVAFIRLSREMLEIKKGEDRASGKRYFYNAVTGRIIEIDEKVLQGKISAWLDAYKAKSRGHDLGVEEKRSWWRRWFGK
jgi:hypothetical protein